MTVMSVRNNIPALNSHGRLKASGKNQARAMERLSSGYRINRASDDAAGLAISEKMRGQIRGLRQAGRNVEDGLSLLKTMDGGMAGIQDMMLRQRELIVFANNDTNIAGDREKIQLEIDQLTEEIGELAERTKFNNIPLLTIPSDEEWEGNTTTPEIPATPGIPPAPVDPPSPPDPPAPPDPPGPPELGSGGLDEVGDLVSGPADMCFVIDVSGSMLPFFDFVKNSVKDFMSALPPGSRVSFILFGDPLNAGTSSPVVGTGSYSPTLDFDAAFAYLDGVRIFGGGSREAGLEGLRDGMDMLAGSTLEKHIVYISDQAAHTADPHYCYEEERLGVECSTFTAADINARLKAEGVTFHGFVPSENPDAVEQVLELADGTGGSTSSLEDLVDPPDPPEPPEPPDPPVDPAPPEEPPEHPVSPPKPPTSATSSRTASGEYGVWYGPLWMQSGANGNQGMFVDRYDCRPKALYRGVFEQEFTVDMDGKRQTVHISKLDVSDAQAGTASLIALDAAFGRVNTYRARAGAQYNRLEFTLESVGVSEENLADAESRIRDADMAKEMMELTKSQTLQQVGVAMLSQANQAPEMVLQLLG